MIDQLYKKLHIIFISSIMLIITLIITVICMNYVSMEKVNESTFFQRIGTLLVYQLENEIQNYKTVMKEYEDKYNIFCTLKDKEDNLLYKSTISSTDNSDSLLKKLQKQTTILESEEVQNKSTTMQGGIFEIKGIEQDKYWGIPVLLITRDEEIYNLSLICEQKDVIEIIGQNMWFYILIWVASCICVILISNFILKRALQPTKRILKSQKEFVATASHELKSPLAVILANMERIDSLKIENDQLQQSMKIVDSECMRMSKLIKDLLLLASSDARTFTINKSNVNIDTLLINLYTAYEPICVSSNIELSLKILDISYPVLYTDRECVFQILSIYIDNAVHHSKNNSSIQIQTAVTSKDITFYIIDHGQGIEEKYKPYIFNRFYCTDKSHTDKFHFGLGLSIADELSKMLGGNVGLEDTEGSGATFYFTLPLK